MPRGPRQPKPPCTDFGQRHRKVLSGRKRRGLDGMDEIDVVLLDLADHVQGYKNLEAPATRNQATAAGILEEKIEPKARLKLAKPRGTAVAGIASGKVKARGTIARCLSKSRTPSAARRPNTSTAAASSSSQAASSSHGARSVPWATGKEPHDPLDAFRDRGPGLKMLQRTINELKEQKLPERRRKTAQRDAGRDRRRPEIEEQQRRIDDLRNRISDRLHELRDKLSDRRYGKTVTWHSSVSGAKRPTTQPAPIARTRQRIDLTLATATSRTTRTTGRSRSA